MTAGVALSPPAVASDEPTRPQAPPVFRWYPVDAPAPVGAGRIGRTLVVGGDALLRSQVVAGLVAAGVEVTLVELVDRGSGDELVAAAMALLTELGPVDGIVDLGVPGSFAVEEPGPWRAALRQTVAVLKAVYDDWAAEPDATRLFYLAVTRMGGRMGYDGAGVAQPLGGIWAGLAKSLPQEIPNCRVKVVDLHDSADPVPYILTELRCWDLFELGWREDQRTTLAAGKHLTRTRQSPARLELEATDTVLLSGGGRGLGFELARELAGRFGCRVLVSGREPLPSSELWALLGDDEFEQAERDRLVDRPDGRTVREIRAGTVRRRARRDVLRNLTEARQRGLRIDYHTGDITDRAFARRLVEAAGPGLRAVIHNAGVASPTRLRNKSVESFVATIETKVDGFTALVGALGEQPVDWFCNVGSVSGRLGGMIGQLDYAAANEALTRLGFWASRPDRPVTTICWPTWQQLGLIANFDAALRYADALPVGTGVQLWIDQLAAAEAGEVMILGGIGPAVSPGQLKGFANFRDHPDTERLQSLDHHLGDVEAYQPNRSIRARTQLPAAAHPCLTEFTVDDRFALPVSVALEYALALGDWVQPEGFPTLWLHRLRDLTITVPHLAGDTTGFHLTKSATGRQTNDLWELTLELTDGSDRPVLTAVAEYHRTPPRTPAAPPATSARETRAHPAARFSPPTSPASRITWAGLLYRANSRDGDELVVREVPASDEWTLPVPPIHRLPHSAIEVILRTAVADKPVREIRVRELGVGSAQGTGELTVSGSEDRGTWQVTDNSGLWVITFNGLEVE